MTQKEARKIMLWKAIERYRTAGGREEHHAYKEALDNYIDDMLDIEEMDEVAHRFAHPPNSKLAARFSNHKKGPKRECQTPQPTPTGRPLGR